MRFLHEPPIPPVFEGDCERCPMTPDEARAWLSALWLSPVRYHIDDDPRTVIHHCGGMESRTFTDRQAVHLADCLEACEIALGTWEAVWEAYYRDPEWVTP